MGARKQQFSAPIIIFRDILNLLTTIGIRVILIPLFYLFRAIKTGENRVSNVVGRRTQEAQKCKTSILLDEVLDEQGGVGSFSIPMDQRYMLQAQLAGARDTGYVSLPGHSVAESLAAGIHSINPGSEMLTFHPCDEVGWTSQRHLGEGSA